MASASVSATKDQIPTTVAIVPRHTLGNLIEDKKPLLTSQLSRKELSVMSWTIANVSQGYRQAGKALLRLSE